MVKSNDAKEFASVADAKLQNTWFQLVTLSHSKTPATMEISDWLMSLKYDGANESLRAPQNKQTKATTQ